MDSVRIYVECNKKDYFAYYLSRITNNLFKKIGLGFYLFFFIVLTAATIMVLGIDTFAIENKLFIVFINVFFWLMVFLLHFWSPYTLYKRNYFINPLSESLWCMDESNIHISNNMTRHTLLWEDIYKILEFKSCFVVHTTPALYYIIPRRCFNNQEQLDAFVNLINLKVGKKRIKLKNYKNQLTQKSQVTSNFDIFEESQENDCLFELNYKLTKKETVKFIFTVSYSKPIYIILTVLGVLALYRYFQLIELNIIFLLVFGVMFAIIIPTLLLILAHNSYKKGLPVQFKFYEDYIISTHPSYTFRVNWADLVRLKETKTDFHLKNNTYAIMIPKRIFENQPDALQKMRVLINQHTKK